MTHSCKIYFTDKLYNSVVSLFSNNILKYSYSLLCVWDVNGSRHFREDLEPLIH